MEMVSKNASGSSDCLGVDINVFTGTTDCGFSDARSRQCSTFVFSNVAVHVSMCQGLCYRGFGSTGTLCCCIHQVQHLQWPWGSPLRGQGGIYSGLSRGLFLLRSLALSLTSFSSEMSSEPVDPSTLDLDDNNLNKITKRDLARHLLILQEMYEDRGKKYGAWLW